jgi:diguanylate cyclase (GGDEF)-like protein/PAS domain S-box-containing protein
LKRDDNNAIVGFEGFLSNVTDNENSKMKLAAVNKITCEGILQHDREIITFADDRMTEMTGRSLAELSCMDGLELIVPEERERIFRELIKESRLEVLATVLKKDGTTIPVRIKSTVITLLDKKYRMLAFSDITEEIKYQKQLKEMATKDYMTGLYNSGFFNELVKNRLKDGLRKKNYTDAIIYLDGNKMKMINDTFGHAEGDKVIQGIADCIKQVVRDTDIVCRKGGDEFCIYLHDVKDQTEKIMQKIINAINELSYHVSIGCRTINFAEESSADIEAWLEVIMKQADKILYKVKEYLKRNKIAVMYHGKDQEGTYKTKPSGFCIDAGSIYSPDAKFSVRGFLKNMLSYKRG